MNVKGRKSLPLRQAFWGVLMLLSLLVMFVAVQSQWDGALPPYDASGAQGGAVGGGSGATDGPGTDVWAKAGDEPGKSLSGSGKPEDGAGKALSEDKNLGDEPGKSLSGSGKPEDGAGRPLSEDENPGDEPGKMLPESGKSGDEPSGNTDEGEEDDKDENAPVIAMTFDDGPFTAVTNRILDVLLEYDAGATFFVVGSRIDMYSDTLKRIYESGFEVASHTWSHKNLNKLSQEKVLKEIDDTKEKLNAYVPVGDVLLRPPYGNANEAVRELAGTPLINWSLDSEDWKSRDADKIIQHVLSTVKDGDIILMHDLYECTAQAVEYLVPELVARGYHIVSVSELFRRKEIPLEEGILYRNPWDCY